MALARAARKVGLERPVVDQHAEGREQDPDVAQDRPAREVLQIRLQPARQVGFAIGRTAVPADLGEAGQAGAQRVAVQ